MGAVFDVIFSGLTRKLELDWDEAEIRLRDDAIRPNWVLCATARRSWKSLRALEKHHAIIAYWARLEHPSNVQRTVGVVELLEEMKREQISTTKTPTGLERSELMVPPFLGQKICFFFARQENCEI